METVCGDALEEWKSLYTEEVEKIWNTERKELRRATMLFHVLRQEFARIESNLNCEMDNFQQKVKLIDDLKKSDLSPSPESPTTKQPLQLHTSNVNWSQLNKSPKLNKHRKSSHLKKPISSPSLLDIQKENKISKNSLAVSKFNHRPESDELFDSPVLKNLLESTVFLDEKVNNECAKTDAFKTPQGVKRLETVDLVDSSIIVEDTPDTSTTKKFKWTRKSNIRRMHSKAKEKKSFTLTQMFDSFPNQRTKVVTNEDKKKNTKQISTPQINLDETDVNDETFFAPVEENHEEKTNKNMRPEGNVLIPNAFFKDYDKIPVPRSTSPQHVHKTETVRRKADRMKLPGWSCSDCEQYYTALALSPEELRKKMDTCSKHRNKYQLLNKTPRGFWDVAMPPTQESQTNDTTRFNF